AVRAMQAQSADRGEGQGTGVGWALSNERGRRCVWHSGGMPGVSTLLRLFPDDRTATIVLHNSDAGDVPREASDRLARIPVPDARAKPRPDGAAGRRPGPRPGDIPARLHGTWKGRLDHPDGEIPITLEIQGTDAARASLGDAPARPLRGLAMRRGR